MRLMFFFIFASASHSFVARLVSSRRLNLPLFLKRISRKGSSSMESRSVGCNPKDSITALSSEAETLTTTENTTPIEDSTMKTKILADAPGFVKPDRDMSEYRWIQLENNLQVLLVSTATEKADSSDENSSAKVEAASIHVQAGHFDDTIPGLAHFHGKKSQP